MAAITRILPQLAAVDESAVEQRLPLVYEGLRQLAAAGRHRPRAAAAAESRQSAI
jgi:hypothetical protein